MHSNTSNWGWKYVSRRTPGASCLRYIHIDIAVPNWRDTRSEGLLCVRKRYFEKYHNNYLAKRLIRRLRGEGRYGHGH